jgi:hypothetical protein
MSGLVWSNLCIADWPREIKGMTLSDDAGDDERQMFGLEAERVETGVVLDGRLFEGGWSRMAAGAVLRHGVSTSLDACSG